MQQQPIATAHHFQPIADEAANAIFARIAFPIHFRSKESEQNFGNAAIALAALMCIQRSQRQNMEVPELRRHGAKIAARRTAAERAAEPLGGVRAQIVEGVHRRK